MKHDPRNTHCVYYATALDGESRVESRHRSFDAAAAAAARANNALARANPQSGGTRLLCGYEVRAWDGARPAGERWVLADDEGSSLDAE